MFSIRILTVILVALLAVVGAADAQDAFDQASTSAAIAGHALGKVHRWLHEVALTKIDAETGLYKADGKWNYRDTAADCYPFFAWAAYVVDRDVLNGPVRDVLHREIALCNTVERIPVPWDFDAGAPVKDLDWNEMVFQASEYVKDGLIAIVEATGPDEWFDRMRAIEDDLWTTARLDTPFGKIPSDNIEVNGEQLQALARLYAMTGEVKYLDWADRLADYYFADEDFVVKRLRDHGCEIIGGLGLLHAVETTQRLERAEEHGARLKKVYDAILAQGCNEDGMMYNQLGDPASGLSDGWGYNYVGYLCYDLATGTDTYRPHVAATLKNMAKPCYQDYLWEGESIDGFADSIEGALYLLNRVPVAEGLAWVDRETKNNLVDHPSRIENGELWGTMKLQANGVRTVLIHALMHTQGVIARPWRPGLEVGAAPLGDGVAIVVRAKEDYRGVLEFDLPRHRVYMGFARDWPRMNTLPEWFTVDPDSTYTVCRGDEPPRAYTGRQLHTGLEASMKAGESLRVEVRPTRPEKPS
ncbi:MAG TPA: hypothetical protein PLO37_08985 [Candidatus Hydrogenedentes bacterium]|nr:hypothetical protein [Candidatus Hydrogenedentota bacterium]HPG66969.1 hypothetical protein [Candidatus Hydrogenedentota bacterium]